VFGIWRTTLRTSPKDLANKSTESFTFLEEDLGTKKVKAKSNADGIAKPSVKAEARVLTRPLK